VRHLILGNGGYDVVTRHGAYPDTPEAYVRAVRRYDIQTGNLRWASTQDYPCEPPALATTGLTVLDHQLLSVQSYLDLTTWWQRLAPHRPCPFRPVVQGDTAESYVRCVTLFGDHGVDLTTIDLICVGSLCRRERSREIVEIAAALREHTTSRLHDFGVKAQAIGLFDDVDSMAWSKAAFARRAKHPKCTAFHPICSSCLVYAAHWHDRMIARHEAAQIAP
jgi:hypothetical protein